MSSGILPSHDGPVLSPAHRHELDIAIDRLERPSFAARLADYAGQPVNAVVKFMPKSVNRRLRQAVRTAIFKCLEMAVASLEEEDGLPSSEWTAKVITGLTGGVGGFFGMVALPIELPLTTTLMLRSIAEIARDEGEDLKSLETLLACLEVFALGGRSSSDKVDVDYYAVRAVLTKLTGEMAAYVMERGALNASSPIIARLVGEIVSRFGLIVSERIAAGAVPIIGAVGGATVNMIFMDHFQRIARGHFVVRRLERTYGTAAIRAIYHEQAARLPSARLGKPVRRDIAAL
jgi:hypothetical protein